MRTTLDLPENLLNEAMRITHAKTKTAVMVLAPEELIRKSKSRILINSKGKSNWILILAKFEYAGNGGTGRYVRRIDYFRAGNKSAELDDLIDENAIVTNDLT